jgi:hypothetical protein
VGGLAGFGASAPGIIAREKFGFTTGCVAEAALPKLYHFYPRGQYIMLTPE